MRVGRPRSPRAPKYTRCSGGGGSLMLNESHTHLADVAVGLGRDGLERHALVLLNNGVRGMYTARVGCGVGWFFW